MMDLNIPYSFEKLSLNERQLLESQFAHNATTAKLDINWKTIPFSRIALVNRLIWQRPETRYLEIGCFQDTLFHALPIANKVGVDPEMGGTHRLTSDDFFEQNNQYFDVIFIDGLHTYEQARRDIVNAFGVLAPGGWIGIHDVIPRTWKEEHVPRISDAWTGDVWKVALELSQSNGIEFQIIMIDHGVGLLRKSAETPVSFKNLQTELQDKRFAYFYDQFPSLPKIEWDSAMDWIERVNQTK